jgi:Ca2+-transporting ATPase
LRILCAAFREHADLPASFEPQALEEDLVFIGLTGMIDPVRPEVKDAIDECRSAGITPIMITGDHRDTAVAIALELGIIDDPKDAITGAQLSEMNDEEFAQKVKEIFVYARVQPEHKTKIVNAWRAHGMITARTGDGVNDAPSIKSADIGVGMGITGTDVTKNVADMVLADDNFASIVAAVGEGRRIYDNIRKSIQFLLASNMSEVLSIFIATLLSFKILLPIHLLFINLVTDCFPALALGLEKAENDIMRRKPRSSKAGIFSDGMGMDVIYQGVFTTVITLAAFFIGEYMYAGVWKFTNISLKDGGEGMTMAFLAMSMCEIFHSFNMRSQRGSIFKMGGQNKYLFLSMAGSLALTSGILFIPALRDVFKFEPISLEEYGIAMALAICIIPAVEIVKAAQRAVTKSKAHKAGDIQ